MRRSDMNIKSNILKYFIFGFIGFFPIVRSIGQSHVNSLETATLPLASLALLSDLSWDKNLTGPYTKALKADKGNSGNKKQAIDLTDTTKDHTIPVLPPELLQFSILTSNTNAMLQWKIAALLQAKELLIEQSTDGIHFSEISSIRMDTEEKINGMVIAQQHERCFYRLKILDTAGAIHYTPNLACNIDLYASGTVSVIPALITDESLSYINITTAYRGRVKITVSDALGQPLITFREEITGDRSKIPIGVATIPKGTYYIFVAKSDGSHIGPGQELQKN